MTGPAVLANFPKKIRMKVAVLLHGSGVYDGTEIHEAVLSLLALAENGLDYQCVAPNVNQYHVVNHLDGSEQEESRNVLVESARIARGAVMDIEAVDPSDFCALVMPGGFGTAKNITTWGINGPEGPILPSVQAFILGMLKASKPVVALCMSPTTVAKALEGSPYHALLSVGSTAEASPYDIAAISNGMVSLGQETESRTVEEISVDSQLKIICAPCYMMEAGIVEVRQNIAQAIKALKALL